MVSFQIMFMKTAGDICVLFPSIGVIAATCLTPLIFREDGGFENLEDLNSRTEIGDNFRRENVENPKYRAFLQRTVKEFELNGFLDT